MTGNSTVPTRNCSRCRQPLPQDVNYCVGCGNYNNADQLIGKQIGFDRQIEDRLMWTRVKMWFQTMFWR